MKRDSGSWQPAAIVMDEPCLGQIGSAASGTGLENMQTCRAAFAAAVRAGEIASTKQFLVRKRFKVIAGAAPCANKRIIYSKRIPGVEGSFGRCVA